MRTSGDFSAVLLTVNYKSEQSTLDLLASLERLNGFESLAVVIIDNCPGEEKSLRLRQASTKHSNLQLLVSDNNRGYFGAAQFGLDHFLVQGHVLPEWIIVCNADVLVADQEFLSKLCSHDCREVGVLAPRIRLRYSGDDQNPFMRQRPGRLSRAKLRLIYSNYLFALLWDWLSRAKKALKIRSGRHQADESAFRETIYAPHGAFLILSRRYFETGGYLDNELFLYGEELSVAEICRSLALPVTFEPQLCVWHDEHSTTGHAISRSSYKYQHKALKHVFTKYFSASGRLDAAEA